MCESLSDIENKDVETLRNEIVEHTKQQVSEFDIKRLQCMRLKQLEPDSKRRYEVKNRELRNERRKKARLDQKNILTEAKNIIINS